MGVTTDEVAPGATAHRMCSMLVRRWLSETHTPTGHGVLDLNIGPLRVTTEITHASLTGAQGFGPIRLDGCEVVDSGTGPPVDRSAAPQPRLLATAIAAESRRRAVADAPVNTVGAPRLPETVARAFAIPERDLDPLAGHGRAERVHSLLRQPADGVPPLVAATKNRAGAHRWLADHLDAVVLPALREAGDPSAGCGFPLLTRQALAAIGLFGRYGVAGEGGLLDHLADRLHEITTSASEPAATRSVARSWLTRRTLTDAAALNGSALRYRRDIDRMLPITAFPVEYEIPNPLSAGERGEIARPPVPELGDGWNLRPVELDASGGGADAELVHAWMHAPHVERTWQQAWSRAEWRKELATQLGGGHSLPCIVGSDGREVAYVEVYRVARDTLARTYPHNEHDLGVHIAIGDPAVTGRGAGSALLRNIARSLLAADPRCVRVVAEPDVHNAASVRAFGKAGYVRACEVGLPSKNSAFMVFSR